MRFSVLNLALPFVFGGALATPIQQADEPFTGVGLFILIDGTGQEVGCVGWGDDTMPMDQSNAILCGQYRTERDTQGMTGSADPPSPTASPNRSCADTILDPSHFKIVSNYQGKVGWQCGGDPWGCHQDPPEEPWYFRNRGDLLINPASSDPIFWYSSDVEFSNVNAASAEDHDDPLSLKWRKIGN